LPFSYYLNFNIQLVERPSKDRALDCGAGIGRITQGFLMKNFAVVDLVEQCGAFLNEAKHTLAETRHKGEFYHSGNGRQWLFTS
jgi:AdoMet dependent proline di-methyltransferase